jgi:hypothetical protein
MCADGSENLCLNGMISPGLGTDGAMAEYMLVDSSRHLVPIEDLDPVRAASLTDAALTPYQAIKSVLPRLVGGSTAVVIGAGGLGHVAIQLLRELTPRPPRRSSASLGLVVGTAQGAAGARRDGQARTDQDQDHDVPDRGRRTGLRRHARRQDRRPSGRGALKGAVRLGRVAPWGTCPRRVCRRGDGACADAGSAHKAPGFQVRRSSDSRSAA